MSFEAQKCLSLMKSDVCTVLAACAFGVISKKPFPNSRSLRFMPMFSSKSFIALPLIFRSSIHFELIFV